jgi:hypothetical protein
VTINNPATYWDPLWTSGRRYRRLSLEEQQLTGQFLGAGRGRPALDVGCGVRHEVARCEWIRLWRSAYAGIVIPG